VARPSTTCYFLVRSSVPCAPIPGRPLEMTGDRDLTLRVPYHNDQYHNTVWLGPCQYRVQHLSATATTLQQQRPVSGQLSSPQLGPLGAGAKPRHGCRTSNYIGFHDCARLESGPAPSGKICRRHLRPDLSGPTSRGRVGRQTLVAILQLPEVNNPLHGYSNPTFPRAPGS